MPIKTSVSVSAQTKPGFKGGNWVGNGGDSLAMAIYSRVRELYKTLKSLTPECALQVPMTKGDFAEILVDLEITTSPTPLYREENGRNVFKEAMNYPAHMTIDFYREAFKGNRDQLILHEMMGLKDIADPGGEASERWVGRVEVRLAAERFRVSDVADGN